MSLSTADEFVMGSASDTAGDLMTEPTKPEQKPPELRLDLVDSELPGRNRRLQGQVAQFQRVLRSSPLIDLQPAVAGKGKGTADAIILALGSAGAFGAFVEIAKSWLAQRSTRSIEITMEAGEPRIVLRAASLSSKQFNQELERLERYVQGSG